MTRTDQDAQSLGLRPGREAGSVQQEHLHEVLVELRQKIKEYAITSEQLFGPDLSAFVRFRDPQTGKTWNGAGRPPNWIRGKDREQFRVR